MRSDEFRKVDIAGTFVRELLFYYVHTSWREKKRPLCFPASYF
jgi:hypothetical protein